MESIKKITISTLMFCFLFGCSGQEFSADKELFNGKFSQTAERKKIDIIMIVDNSTSMFNDQVNLSREFANFISSIEQADYRIGVITTDVKSLGKEKFPGFYGNLDQIGDNGELFISSDSPNPAELFRSAIHREETIECHGTNNGNCVSPNEMPLKALRMAIEKKDTVNSGFFRSDAELGVIIITDEDETVDPIDGSFTSADDFLNFFEDEFSGSKLLKAFAISILAGESECLERQRGETITGAAVYGIEVSRFADLTGGFNVSICSENYGSEMKRISNFVEDELLITRIAVPSPPVAKSIQLEVVDKDGIKLDIKWRIVPGYLELYPAPPEGSVISLSFRF